MTGKPVDTSTWKADPFCSPKTTIPLYMLIAVIGLLSPLESNQTLASASCGLSLIFGVEVWVGVLVVVAEFDETPLPFPTTKTIVNTIAQINVILKRD